MTREKFETQLNKLNNNLLKMSIMVEDSINKAVYALKIRMQKQPVKLFSVMIK